MAFNAKNCLKLEMLEDNSALSLTGAYFILTTKDPLVDTWELDSIENLNEGDQVYIRHTGTVNSVLTISGSAKVVGGNFLSLLDDGAGDVNTPLTENAFRRLFEDQPLKSITENCLPSKTLAKNCYDSMFQRSDITKIPNKLLPAKNLASNCYVSMFSGTKITSIPKKLLPATTLANGCYASMFYQCTEIREAPTELLPAKFLVSSCYSNMFADCTKLEKATLHGATLQSDSCYQMFYQCSALREITSGFSAWDSYNCEDWVGGVNATGDFYATDRNLLEQHGSDYCPSGWTFHRAPIVPSRKKVGFLVAGLQGIFED